jgi:EPS-associated MarR family transcriptional regulator
MKNEHFEILRKLNKDSSLSQRELAKKLGLSLGKINYCLSALKDKGLIKINNFKNKKNKASYLYILTAKGIAEKTKNTLRFMKRKMDEYDELQKELKKK